MRSLFFIAVMAATPAFAQEAGTSGAQAAESVQQAEAKPAPSIGQDFDALGGNRIMLERAKELQPETETWVVQGRMVPRDMRFEIAPEFSGAFGGDSYVNTRSIGLNTHFHINPRWSLGVKYTHSMNQLTPEGERLLGDAVAAHERNPFKETPFYPEFDYPKSELIALVNWYPFYGKMNMLDRAIAHFDLYLIGGYGTTTLSSGPAATMVSGAGVGFWVNPKLSARMEMRYHNYKAKYMSGEKKLDPGIASLQIGWLL